MKNAIVLLAAIMFALAACGSDPARVAEPTTTDPTEEVDGEEGIGLDEALAMSPDSDGDGVLDLQENCRFVVNPDQQDGNQDGIGDACEFSTPVTPADPDVSEDHITIALRPPAEPYPSGVLPALLVGEHHELATSYDPEVHLLTFRLSKELLTQPVANTNAHLYFEGEPSRYVGRIDVSDATTHGVAILGGGPEDCLRLDQFSLDGSAELVVGNGSVAVEVPAVDDEPFLIGALGWNLQIGATEIGWGYSPDGSMESLLFPLPAESIALFEDGDPVGIYYGDPGNPLGVELIEVATLRIASDSCE